jgi:plastocyanin
MKFRKSTFLLFVISAATAIYLNGCAQKQAQVNTPPPAAPAPAASPAVPAVPATEGQIRNVTIKNFAFEPAELSITAGDTVAWANEDSAPHTIKSDLFQSGALATGDTYQFKFDTAGEYSYNCGIHPSMQGKIIVK